MVNKTHKLAIEKWRIRKAQMLALIASGKSMAAIGRKYNISRQRVRQIVSNI
jgi:DNA-binding CsgD family transcriptional regulator